MSGASWWRACDDGIELRVRVVPGARKTELMEVLPDSLRVRVAAPPVEGKANQEICSFIAGLYGVRVSAVSVVAGHHSRDKRLRVRGVAAPPALLLSP